MQPHLQRLKVCAVKTDMILTKWVSQRNSVGSAYDATVAALEILWVGHRGHACTA